MLEFTIDLGAANTGRPQAALAGVTKALEGFMAGLNKDEAQALHFARLDLDEASDFAAFIPVMVVATGPASTYTHAQTRHVFAGHLTLRASSQEEADNIIARMKAGKGAAGLIIFGR